MTCRDENSPSPSPPPSIPSPHSPPSAPESTTIDSDDNEVLELSDTEEEDDVVSTASDRSMSQSETVKVNNREMELQLPIKVLPNINTYVCGFVFMYFNYC